MIAGTTRRLGNRPCLPVGLKNDRHVFQAQNTGFNQCLIDDRCTNARLAVTSIPYHIITNKTIEKCLATVSRWYLTTSNLQPTPSNTPATPHLFPMVRTVKGKLPGKERRGLLDGPFCPHSSDASVDTKSSCLMLLVC